MSKRRFRWDFILMAVSVILTTVPSSSAALTAERVSISSSGVQGNYGSANAAVSGDGRYVAFDSMATKLVSGDTNRDVDVFVFDRQSQQVRRVSVGSNGTQGNRTSGRASVSADGRYVAFHSSSTNLVSGDTNGLYDVFVHDTVMGVTERVSLSTAVHKYDDV